MPLPFRAGSRRARLGLLALALVSGIGCAEERPAAPSAQRVMYSVRASGPGAIMAGALVAVENEPSSMVIARPAINAQMACAGEAPCAAPKLAPPRIVANFTPIVREGRVETRVVLDDRATGRTILDTVITSAVGERFSVHAVAPAHHADGAEIGESVYRLDVAPKSI